MYRQHPGGTEVLLVHPGGPYYRRKDAGVWTIPKGLVGEEDLLAAAVREFREETGVEAGGPFQPLGSIRMKSGKVVHAWACAGSFDPRKIVSNTFPVEWPPKSGRMQDFPEVDRGDFFDLPTARQKIHPAQMPLLDALERLLEGARFTVPE